MSDHEPKPIVHRLSMSSPEDERERFWRAVELNAEKITELEAVVNTRQEMMRETITQAVQSAMPKAMLTDDEHRWVQLAIKREVQQIAFRQAVIEKSSIALIWAGIVFLGIVAREYMVAHGMWKP